MMTDTEFEDLQIRISFQEDMIESLNKRVSEQQTEIDKLYVQLQHLNNKMKQFEASMESAGLGDDQPPPHY